jgi:hypothetical protein
MSNPTGSILLRRGPTADRLAFCPLDGEVIYDTTLKQMFVGDGVTFGGRGISGVVTTGDILPPQASNNGKYLFTNGSIASWQTVDALPSQTGNDGKYLKTNAGVASWASLDPANNGLLTLSTAGIGLSGSQVFYANQADNSIFTITSNATDLNTPLTIVSRDSSGNFTAGTITANITGNVTGTVTDGVVTTGRYANPAWITNLALTQGGTGGTNRVDALTNLLPVGEANGYVLKTSGRGTYFWSSETGASGTQGQTVSTVRSTITATANQTVFTTSEYVVGAGQLRVYIDGVRQFPSEYTETSTTSFTLDVGVPVGTEVFVEIDAFVGQAITASNVVNAPAGNITSISVQDAINELDQEKAPIASPTFTGTVTIPAGASISGYAPLASPTFTGTVAGITATMVGLGNVTNESKATMFTSPTFTGNVTLKSIIENTTTISSAPTASLIFDVLTQGVLYYTANNSTNFSLNFRGGSTTTLNSALSVGQSITVVLMVTNGAVNAYYPNSYLIDGTPQTIKWQGGSTPLGGNLSATDVYTFTIIKTTAVPNYTVLGAQTKFA